MKHLYKLTMLLIALMMSISLMADGTQPAGSGTEGSPYQVATLDNLLWISTNNSSWDKYFIQTANIVFVAADFQSGGGFYNSGEGFIPIGNTTTKFTGEYDGDDYAIDNLYINQSTSSSDYLGFFGYIDGANITDLTLPNIEVKGMYAEYVEDEYEHWYWAGSKYIGGLVGYAINTNTISGCSVSGDVLGYKYIGGLIGYISGSSSVTNCNSSGSITINLSSSQGGTAGGLIGEVHSTTCFISNCNSTASVISSSSNGASIIGGFVGSNTGEIENCYATGDITGTGFTIGGFVGNLTSSSVDISSCYSTGNVEAGSRAGGFVGNMYNQSTIKNCYSRGDVTRISGGTGTDMGGFCGLAMINYSYYDAKIEKCYSTGSVVYDGASDPTDKGFVGATYIRNYSGYYSTVLFIDNYFDNEASNQTTSGESSATAKNTSQMQTQGTFTNWDFTGSTCGTDYYWEISSTDNDGYPHLCWQIYFIWDGSEGTAWNTPGNWSDGSVPTASDNVLIANVTNGPVITNITALCNNITLNSGAELLIEDDGNLTISGDLTNDGTLTVQSNGDGTGSLIVNGTATGNVTVERYLTADKWHYISGQTNISDDFTTCMGLGTPGSSTNSFYRWDESYVTNENPGTWIDILNGPIGDGTGDEMGTTFTACRGYAVTYASTNKTLTLTGTPYIENKIISISYTSESTNPGANLVGNPFSSDIAINSNAQATNNFITQNASVLYDEAQAVYFWDDTQNDYVAKSDVGNVFAAPGQGFMVIAKEANAPHDLEFNVSIRKHGSPTFYKSNNNKLIKLKVTDSENRINTSDIAFLPDMTNGLDPSYDAMKLKGNPNIALYTRLVEDNGTDFAIQALNDVNIESYVIPVGVDVSEETILEISISQTNMYKDVYLEDKLLNTSVNLSEQNYSAVISNSGIGRFYLHFSPVGINNNINPNNEFQIYSHSNTITIINNHNLNGIVNIVNIMGQEVASFRLSGDNTQRETINVPAGVYIVYTEADNGNVYSEKIIVN